MTGVTESRTFWSHIGTNMFGYYFFLQNCFHDITFNFDILHVYTFWYPHV
ncbi:hypothetical protein PMIN01_10208 [Paraphaeosphaeria minitans]|uniref:Uncharacterized protein n=1 Tax=Paraphaeosphaeria minitans TaxID=565426 RepID=A0A9P6KN79_9PLEO|nr:hypothetical protein PMIN01_10208 [Paraphaeosphaeria minitans]